MRKKIFFHIYYNYYKTFFLRGPFVPWTAVVDSYYNLIIQKFNDNENLRSWENYRLKPITKEFEIALSKNFIGRAKIYLPMVNDKKCNKKMKLILKLPDKPNSQLVNAKYDISITRYLTIKEGYLILEVKYYIYLQ